ncbi:DUF6493 family protein [Streptosporangium sp. NPDC002721]|uniref:DUF7824 domain-containing protein n=1 Tax=Streptosporangium sp. NPDC002721 TaxID=3366188 RepID=UPI0036A89AF8
MSTPHQHVAPPTGTKLPASGEPSRTSRREEVVAPVSAWEEIRGLIDRKDAYAVAIRVTGLDEEARGEVAANLPGYLKTLRGRQESWERLDEHAEVLRAAGAGVLPGAAAVATWLNRRDFSSRWSPPYGDTRRIMTILAARPAEWRADLARRLVLRLRTAEDRGMELALALLRETGTEVPAHDPVVVGWAGAVAGLPAPHRDPLFDVMLPRLFEAQGVGRALQWESDPDRSLLRALRTLAATDGARRSELLQGCVRRFLLGGSVTELRFFVRLHEALDPTPHEIEPLARDYLRLLPAAPGPVAELALRHLRGLDALDVLDPLDLLEGWEAVLFRPERKLVRAGLTWLDQRVRLSPGLAASVAGPLATVLAADSVELQERALTLAIKYAGLMDDEGRGVVRDALGALPPDLGRRAFEVFGGEEPVEAGPRDGFDPPALPRPEAPRRMPEPIDSVADMVSLLNDSDDWQAWERLLAGFVSLVHRDRAGAAAAFEPLLAGRYEYLYGEADHWDRAQRWQRVDHWLIGAVYSLVGIAPERGIWRSRLSNPRYVSPPHLLLLHRAAEIQMAVEQDVVPPLLLATPTLTTGHVEAAELVTRLEVIEAAGAKPLAADLQQALIRLPREPDGEAAERAGRLSSAAGRLVARWLSGTRIADPVVEMGWSHPAPGHDNSGRNHSGELRPVPSVRAQATGQLLVDRTFATSSGRGDGLHLAWWPSMFPSHREVAAAHLSRHLLNHPWYHPTVQTSHLRELARLDGPPGAAVALLLARMLGDPDTPEAVDVLLTMAGRGDLPAAELGRRAAELVEYDQTKLVHLTAALESAARQGAHEEVWTAVAAALPSLLPRAGRRPRHGLAGFVELAATTAAWCGARGVIPEIEAMAARKGSSGLLREARRLHGLLTAKEG